MYICIWNAFIRSLQLFDAFYKYIFFSQYVPLMNENDVLK